MTCRCSSPAEPRATSHSSLSLPHTMLQPHWSSWSPSNIAPSYLQSCPPAWLVLLVIKIAAKISHPPRSFLTTTSSFISSPPSSFPVQHYHYVFFLICSLFVSPTPLNVISQRNFLYCTVQCCSFQAHQSAQNKVSAWINICQKMSASGSLASPTSGIISHVFLFLLREKTKQTKEQTNKKTKRTKTQKQKEKNYNSNKLSSIYACLS